MSGRLKPKVGATFVVGKGGTAYGFTPEAEVIVTGLRGGLNGHQWTVQDDKCITHFVSPASFYSIFRPKDGQAPGLAPRRRGGDA